MPYRTVTKPIPFPRAFGATSDAAILSQAAILLLMEPALRRDRARLAEHQSARRTLKVPAISARGQRVKVEEVESPLRLRPLSSERQVAAGDKVPASRQRLRQKTQSPGGRQLNGGLPSASAPACQSGRGSLLFWTHVGTEPSDRHFGRLYPQRR